MSADGNAGGKLTLTIAGNSGVPPEVVPRQLRTIASRCHSFRKDRGTTYLVTHSSTTKYHPPPIHPPFFVSEYIADRTASIYRHSIDKFVSRIEKRYVAFPDFIEKRYVAFPDSIERLEPCMATAFGSGRRYLADSTGCACRNCSNLRRRSHYRLRV